MGGRYTELAACRPLRALLHVAMRPGPIGTGISQESKRVPKLKGLACRRIPSFLNGYCDQGVDNAPLVESTGFKCCEYPFPTNGVGGSVVRILSGWSAIRTMGSQGCSDVGAVRVTR